MENIDYSTIVALLPGFVSQMTTHLKAFIPNKSIIPFVPYVVGVLSTLGLYFVYGEQSIGMYILNGLSIAYSAASSYAQNKGKTEIVESTEEEVLPNIREDV